MLIYEKQWMHRCLPVRLEPQFMTGPCKKDFILLHLAWGTLPLFNPFNVYRVSHKNIPLVNKTAQTTFEDFRGMFLEHSILGVN